MLLELESLECGSLIYQPISPLENTCLKSLIVTCLDHTEGEGIAIPSFHPNLTQLISGYLTAFLLSAFEVMLAQNQPATSHYQLPA